MLSLLHSFSAWGFLYLCSMSSAQTTSYDQPCPLLNLNFPEVPSYGSNTVVQDAMQNLLGGIVDVLSNTSTLTPFGHATTAFSMDVYSLYDKDPLFTYHSTPDALRSQHTVGVDTVGSNTVYRIGSVSKLYTVYLYLIAAGDETWNQPVGRFIPEIASYAEQTTAMASNNDTDRVDWDSITLGALASQLAGIARDAAYSAVLEKTIESFGLPVPSRDTTGACGDDSRLRIPCNRTAFFEEYLLQHPVVPPLTTAIYSNAAFQILAYAVENITGVAMSELFENELVRPLGLNSTFYTIPPSMNTSFIPGNATTSWWDADALDEAAAGGYYSSINDMRIVGQAMLNSSLLTPAQTRRWMKPHSLTSNVNYSVGAPWEILRAPVEPVSWMYTKSGDIGAYAAMIVLLPEYGVGFSVLAAGSDPVNAVRVLSDMSTTVSVPALQAAVQMSSASIYEGNYVDESTNSTIGLKVADTGTGLAVTSWTVGGQQILPLLGALYGANETTQNLTAHLYYTGLSSDDGTTTSWRAVFQVLPQVEDDGPFSTNCDTWVGVDAFTYGGIGLDEFLFTLGANRSSVVSVQPRALGYNFTNTAGSSNMPTTLQKI